MFQRRPSQPATALRGARRPRPSRSVRTGLVAVLAGAALVVTGDVISMLARHRARQA